MSGFDSVTRGVSGSDAGDADSGVSGKKNIFTQNIGRATPTPGFMSDSQVKTFLAGLISNCPELNDLVGSDYEELRVQMLSIIVMFGGEERSYIRDDLPVVNVGGKDRKIVVNKIPECARAAGSVVRGFTRRYSGEIYNLLQSCEVKDYFREFFGATANPMFIRGDLLHKGFSHKFDPDKLDILRTSKLKDAEE